MRSILWVIVLVPAAIFQAQADEDQRGAPADDSVKVDAYTEAVPKTCTFAQTYPTESGERSEGWAAISMMVDTKGRPYEVTVVDSNGNRVLDDAAIKTIQSCQYKPATSSGQPIDSSVNTSVTFRLAEKPGASKKFAATFTALKAAIGSKDKEGANAILADLRTRTLYEEAYANLARYQFYRQWGSEAQQLDALRNAVGRGDYLSGDVKKLALTALLQLEIRTNNLENAMDAWNKLKKLPLDQLERDEMQVRMDRVDAVRTGDMPFEIAGEIPRRLSWTVRLSRRKFDVVVLDGHVDQLKLRCKKQYVAFRFDPALRYSVAPTAGICDLEVLGDEGTKFDLVQQ